MFETIFEAFISTLGTYVFSALILITLTIIGVAMRVSGEVLIPIFFTTAFILSLEGLLPNWLGVLSLFALGAVIGYGILRTIFR